MGSPETWRECSDAENMGVVDKVLQFLHIDFTAENTRIRGYGNARQAERKVERHEKKCERSNDEADT
jgi:hypothetical protein